MPKIKKSSKIKRNDPLEKQLYNNNRNHNRTSSAKKVSYNIENSMEDSNDEDELGLEKIDKKTLELARIQKEEVEKEDIENRKLNILNKNKLSTNDSKKQYDNDNYNDSDDSDHEENETSLINQMNHMDESNIVRLNNGYIEDIELCEEDEVTLNKFMMGPNSSLSDHPNFNETRNLADIIIQKIYEKENNIQINEKSTKPDFNPKIIEVYTGIGKILKRYTCGKLPKAFKIIPSLSFWEDILWLTEPEKWSPHAMYEATKLFASNLNAKMSQRFYNIFLLEHIRQDIRDNKKLNFHLYMALKKSIYKPSAFFKGIILPLCDPVNNCTLKEAIIIGSVLSKVSIPVMHSAAALMKMTENNMYSGATSIFIKLLLEKKYSLPKRLIHQLSNYFCEFINDKRVLPVLWHQSLLLFAQRYKNDIPQNDKDNKLKALMKVHFHHQITPEIRREIYN